VFVDPVVPSGQRNVQVEPTAVAVHTLVTVPVEPPETMEPVTEEGQGVPEEPEVPEVVPADDVAGVVEEGVAQVCPAVDLATQAAPVELDELVVQAN